MKNYSADNLIYLDETGIRKNESINYGWAKRGQRLFDLRCGARNKVLNIIGSLKQGKIIAPFAFEGSCDVSIFNCYLFKVLKPVLTKDSVIILDNASFHRASNLDELCEQVGCQYLFLPPYSPDKNKIEGYWVSVKTKMRKILRDSHGCLMEAITDTFMAINKNE